MVAARPLSVLLAGSALLVAGCGSSTDDPKSASFSQPEQKAVANAVEDFSDAARKRDYSAICDDQLAAGLVKALDRARRGGTCADRLEVSLRDVTATDLAVRAIRVAGTSAVATVQSTGTGDAEPQQRIELVKEGSRWKLSGLA